MVADPRAPFPAPLSDSDPTFRALLARQWFDESARPLARRAALARGLDHPLELHRVALPVVPELASEATLVRVATDADPASGNVAPDLVLGPLADEPVSWRTLQIAVAMSAFFAGDAVRGPPWQRWQRARPAPSREDRSAVRAIAAAPLAPWRVRSVAGPQAVLEDQVGLSPLVHPIGPVHLREPAQPFGPLRPGMTLLARVAREPGRWVATCPVALPGGIPTAVESWLTWMAWELRLTFRGRVTRTELLARRGHVLARRLVEVAWLDA